MATWKIGIIGLFLIALGTFALSKLAADDNGPAEAGGAGETAPPASAEDENPDLDIEGFLADYDLTWRRLWTAAEGAKWTANVDITDENERAVVVADRALGDFVGSRETVTMLRRLRNPGVMSRLTTVQRRQLDAAWRLAAHYPGTAPELVGNLVAAEAAQTSALYSYEFMLELPGEEARPVTSNEIARLLATSDDPAHRRAVWECSKSIGPGLRNGLARLRDLRNGVAREMDYTSFFGLEVADYDLTSDEMMALMDELLAGIRPLYEQLHCWVRHEQARRFGVDVPQLLPAHWIGNRWAQEWPGLVEGLDLDGLFADRSPEWIVRRAEDFYTSLGMPQLPETFWQLSDLYELPEGSTRVKNSHASAWHIDLDQDVRSLMSVEANYDWFTTTHHELGHVYYYLAYSNDEVPFVLRAGANRGFHEGIGTLVELASNQVPYLQRIGLMSEDETPDQIRWLLSQALRGPVTFLPFACGTMTHFEHDLYEEDLPVDRFNERWWQYVRQYQGVAAPSPRGEEYCDAATKTHINNDPAQYYDYAISSVILHQLHRHICTTVLDCDVRTADYYGNAEVGDYLTGILRRGATGDWRQLMLEATGSALSSEAMLEYFQPLLEWLRAENTGRQVGF